MAVRLRGGLLGGGRISRRLSRCVECYRSFPVPLNGDVWKTTAGAAPRSFLMFQRPSGAHPTHRKGKMIAMKRLPSLLLAATMAVTLAVTLA